MLVSELFVFTLYHNQFISDEEEISVLVMINYHKFAHIQQIEILLLFNNLKLLIHRIVKHNRI